jgi:hypothetical protein
MLTMKQRMPECHVLQGLCGSSVFAIVLAAPSVGPVVILPAEAPASTESRTLGDYVAMAWFLINILSCTYGRCCRCCGGPPRRAQPTTQYLLVHCAVHITA